MQQLQMEAMISPKEIVNEMTIEHEKEQVQVQQTLTGEEISTLPDVRTTDGHLMDSALPRYMKMMGNLSFVPDDADEWVHYLTDAADRPVREVMTRQVSQVPLGKSELAVAHRMVHDGVSSVVITDGGKVVGMVNRLDLYAAIEGID